MKKIKDLIEIPEIETVIKINELYDYDQKSLQDKIYDTFILTEEVLFGVSILIKKIAQRQNAGFIVKGSYGSGKSHFLAYMAAISENVKLFRNLASVSSEIAPFQKDFFPGEILAVPVSLTSYTQDISLENAVFDSIRKKLTSKGIPFPSSISNKIIEDFKTFVSEDLAQEFFETYADKTVDEQALRLREFLIAKNLSFTPVISRDDFYLLIQKSLRQHFPGGILLLIDEVSEFLRSRAELDVNSEDIRFLQFLGEWNLPLNCWTVLSMQEDIEEISGASEQALNKIRDRFNNRIYLSTTHIKELLGKRLSIKKENSRQDIANVYAEFKDYFPTWKLSLDEFYNIYPVHPATVYYLESVANLFSKARGMVEFFYNSLHAVDAESHLPYIENNANVLITPDKVFDNFYDKIQENQALHDFIDQIYKDFVKEMALIFQETGEQEKSEIEEEKQVAYAIVKILILTEIAPGLKKLTIGKLAELTGKGISQLEQKANINFIRHILNKVMRAFSYIKKEEVDGRYDDVYYISPEKSVLDRFAEEVNNNFARIVNIEKKAIRQLIRQCSDARLPLQKFYENEIIEISQWQETPRKFLITLAMPDRITADMLKLWDQQINRGSFEYVVIPGYPVIGAENTTKLWDRVAELSPRFRQSIVYWRPNAISEKNNRLLSRYYAEQYTYQIIQRENPNFLGDVDATVRRRIDELKHDALNMLMEAYFPPLLLGYENEDLFGEIARVIIDFNQLKQRLTDKILTRLYEEHKKIKPIISEPPLTSINEVINYINENLTGHHFAVASESMKSLIKNLVEKLYLIKIVGHEIVITPRPEQSHFIRELLKTIEEEKPHYKYLFKKFRQSLFGCTEPQFIFALYLLSAAGFIQIHHKNRPIKSNQVTVTIIENADLITPGEQVSQLFLKQYHKLTPLVGEIKLGDLHLKGQEKVWENLLEFKERYEEFIQNKILLLERFGNTRPFSQKTFSHYLKSLNYLKEVLNQIKRSSPSGMGIERVLNFVETEVELQQSVVSLAKIKNFDNANLQHIIFIYQYVNHPIIPQVLAETELYESHQAIVEKLNSFEKGFDNYVMESLFSEFEQFKSSYRTLYTEYHEKLYPKEYYAEIARIRESSEFNTLKHFSEIELIAVKNDFNQIKNILDTISANLCQRDLFSELQAKPVCSCQLKGTILEKKYSKHELMEKIKAGIAEYLNAIKSEENYNKIMKYKVAANQVRDAKSDETLDYFLNMDLSTFPSLTELEKNINPRAIASLNEALSGDIIFVEKNIKELTDELCGRKIKPDQLKQVFFRWLAEDTFPPGEVYVAINDPAQNISTVPALQLPAFVAEQVNTLLPGEKIEQALEKIVSAYLFLILKESKIDIVHFKQDALKPENVKKIVDLLPQDMNLLACLPQTKVSILNEFLKLDDLPIDSLVGLYNSLPRFPEIRKQVMAAIYKKMNTFDIAAVIDRLTDQSEDTFFLKEFLTLCLLEKRPFAIPESPSQFLNFAVDQIGFFLSGQQLTRVNERNNYLPLEFSHFFDNTIRARLTKLENKFSEKLPDWERERNLISSHIRRIMQKEAAKFIIIDGLRADFYRVLRDQLVEQAGLILVEEKYCLSLAPADTETYYQFLDDLQAPVMKTVEREYNIPKFKERFLADTPETSFYIISFLDEKIHAEKAGIADVLAEFVERMKFFLFPILAQLEKDATFYLSGDHGFVEKSDYHAKDKVRYAHGGDSLYERIVPIGKFRKI